MGKQKAKISRKNTLKEGAFKSCVLLCAIFINFLFIQFYPSDVRAENLCLRLFNGGESRLSFTEVVGDKVHKSRTSDERRRGSSGVSIFFRNLNSFIEQKKTSTHTDSGTGTKEIDRVTHQLDKAAKDQALIKVNRFLKLIEDLPPDVLKELVSNEKKSSRVGTLEFIFFMSRYPTLRKHPKLILDYLSYLNSRTDVYNGRVFIPEKEHFVSVLKSIKSRTSLVELFQLFGWKYEKDTVTQQHILYDLATGSVMYFHNYHSEIQFFKNIQNEYSNPLVFDALSMKSTFVNKLLKFMYENTEGNNFFMDVVFKEEYKTFKDLQIETLRRRLQSALYNKRFHETNQIFIEFGFVRKAVKGGHFYMVPSAGMDKIIIFFFPNFQVKYNQYVDKNFDEIFNYMVSQLDSVAPDYLGHNQGH